MLFGGVAVGGVGGHGGAAQEGDSGGAAKVGTKLVCSDSSCHKLWVVSLWRVPRAELSTASFYLMSKALGRQRFFYWICSLCFFPSA